MGCTCSADADEERRLPEAADATVAPPARAAAYASTPPPTSVDSPPAAFDAPAETRVGARMRRFHQQRLDHRDTDSSVELSVGNATATPMTSAMDATLYNPGLAVAETASSHTSTNGRRDSTTLFGTKMRSSGLAGCHDISAPAVPSAEADSTPDTELLQAFDDYDAALRQHPNHDNHSGCALPRLVDDTAEAHARGREPEPIIVEPAVEVIEARRKALIQRGKANGINEYIDQYPPWTEQPNVIRAAGRKVRDWWAADLKRAADATAALVQKHRRKRTKNPKKKTCTRRSASSSVQHQHRTETPAGSSGTTAVPPPLDQSSRMSLDSGDGEAGDGMAAPPSLALPPPTLALPSVTPPPPPLLLLIATTTATDDEHSHQVGERGAPPVLPPALAADATDIHSEKAAAGHGRDDLTDSSSGSLGESDDDVDDFRDGAAVADGVRPLTEMNLYLATVATRLGTMMDSDRRRPAAITTGAAATPAGAASRTAVRPFR